MEHPAQSQQPIIRSNLGGTIYFDIEEYQAYEPLKIAYETANYKVISVKPLHNRQEKRLAAFVVPKKEDFDDDIPKITRHIEEEIKMANIFAAKKTESYLKDKPARVIWCYFGKDESDILNSTHYAYSIWSADEKTEEKYCRLHMDAYTKDGIYIFKNSSYQMLRSMRDDSVNLKEYKEDVRKLFYSIIENAEKYISCMTEVYNRTQTIEEAREKYLSWTSEVYQLFYRLNDIAIAPEQIHDWVEEVMQLAGWVIDMTLVLQKQKETTDFDDRSRWLFQNASKHYYESLEKLAIQNIN